MATDVSVGLPDVSVEGGNTFTVTLDDASAKITSMIVHVWQVTPETEPAPPVVEPLFAYGSNL